MIFFNAPNGELAYCICISWSSQGVGPVQIYGRAKNENCNLLKPLITTRIKNKPSIALIPRENFFGGLMTICEKFRFATTP